MSRLHRNLVRAVLVLLLGAIAAGAWSFWRKASEVPLEQRYQLEDLIRGDVTQTVTANGTLNPVVLVNVGTQVSGTVRKLYADFNSRVKKDQVLLELDPTTFKAAVEQSTGNLANAEASLRLAKANEQRARELFALEYVSRQDLDQAIQAREAAQAQVQSARGQLQKDRANLAYSIIRSPVSGVVVSRQVDLGQTVAASFQTPTLFQIAQDLSQMQIDSNVAEADIGHIKVGQRVRFTVDAFQNRRFEGSVRQIRLNPITQQNVVTYDVVVAVANPDLILMPGMTAYLTFIVDQRENALLVPNTALRFRPRDAAKPSRPNASGARVERGTRPEPTAYVIRDDEITPVRLKTGITDGKYTEVLEGLKAGDRVVVEDNLPEPRAPGGQTPFRMRAF
ncbi:MAG: efflux RND transporter periplasmic adaptor subunit [Proteobacteria bacterium]|nr:MAG: efflux RND transporter periplasmic adaptor subunit [Pseudomonadota bacterium]